MGGPNESKERDSSSRSDNQSRFTRDLQSDDVEIIELVTKCCNMARWLADDIVSEANLAIVEAKKRGENHKWIIDRIKIFTEQSINFSRNEISQPKIESGYLPKPIEEKKLSLKQRKKILRDIAIRLSRSGGMTITSLAIVFDLKISRIKEIIEDGKPLA